jgi:hypothetical protein
VSLVVQASPAEEVHPGEEFLRGRKGATGCEEEGVAGGGEEDAVNEGGPGRWRGGRKKEVGAEVREDEGSEVISRAGSSVEGGCGLPRRTKW